MAGDVPVQGLPLSGKCHTRRRETREEGGGREGRKDVVREEGGDGRRKRFVRGKREREK